MSLELRDQSASVALVSQIWAAAQTTASLQIGEKNTISILREI